MQSLALAVNRVLTACYSACYPGANEADELVLLTAPLAAVTEVQALYDSKIIDAETAVPVALHSLGASVAEIDGALKRRRKLDNPQRKRENDQADADIEQTRASTDATRAQIEQTKANTDVAKASVAKVNADTYATKKQADSPPKPVASK